MEHGLEAWHDFLVAEVGATAALSGLVTVAVSINLAQILKHKSLPGRAAESLLYLGSAMVASSLALVPQPLFWLGAELASVGAIIWLSAMAILLQALRDAAAPR